MELTERERERLFDELARHAAADRLDMAELERRVAIITAARTREEAAACFADLPPLPVKDAPPRPPADTARPRRGRGHAEAERPRPDWQPTAERFRDPRSGRVMRVWVDAAGTRHYVIDE